MADRMKMKTMIGGKSKKIQVAKVTNNIDTQRRLEEIKKKRKGNWNAVNQTQQDFSMNFEAGFV